MEFNNEEYSVKATIEAVDNGYIVKANGKIMVALSAADILEATINYLSANLQRSEKGQRMRLNVDIKPITNSNQFTSVVEQRQNEAVRILRSVVENAVHVGGGDYRINEVYLGEVREFLDRITD